MAANGRSRLLSAFRAQFARGLLHNLMQSLEGRELRVPLSKRSDGLLRERDSKLGVGTQARVSCISPLYPCSMSERPSA